MKFVRIAALIALPLLLASCLYSPGKFTSAMTVRADGAFTFSYKGEILFLSLYQMMKDGPMGDGADAKCYGPVPGTEPTDDMGMMDMNAMEAADKAAADAIDAAGNAIDHDGNATNMNDDFSDVAIESTDTSSDWGERDCTPAELTDRAEMQKAKTAKDAEQAKQLEQVLGFNPEDEQSMQAFAQQITKQAGWKSVVYRGKGVFDVDYQIAGKLDRDFIFPVFPDAAFLYPMVLARARADGSVQITAPAFATTANNPMAAMAMVGALAGEKKPGDPEPSVANGSFTILTDAQILTNNTEDGPVAEGMMQTLFWSVNAKTAKVPETLLRLRK